MRPTNAVKSFQDLSGTVKKIIKCYWNEYFSFRDSNTKIIKSLI